jgi:hypothetical protein
MAIDNAGNLYAVWEQAPLTATVISGDIALKFAYSTDQGNTWSTPLEIDLGFSCRHVATECVCVEHNCLPPRGSMIDRSRIFESGGAHLPC